MKKLACILMSLILILSTVTVVFADSQSSLEENAAVNRNEKLIHSCAKTVNEGDIESYINLFTEDIQNEYRDYIKNCKTEAFFKWESVEICNIRKLSDEVGKQSASLSSTEEELYDAFEFYYVEMIVDAEDEIADLYGIDTGNVYSVFVIAKEDNSWKLYRLATPNMNIITNANEGFGSNSETAALIEQNEKVQHLLESLKPQEVEMQRAIPTAEPVSIRVRFDNSANRTAYNGAYGARIDFDTYLKNVLPNEWTVALGESYPAYLQAGAMASKMYGWYHIINPKYGSDPLFPADVKDGTTDQTFLMGSYSGLGSYYRPFADAAISYNRNMAMLNSLGDMFEPQYRTSSGSQYSGYLNQEESVTLAANGYSMYQILGYYYNYSTVVGGSNLTIRMYSWA